ncbi:MAG: hypothetical protein PCFJNLEI_00639 [Verrucomicrobiae bacterium]|nr:hypothetical protein [Verrucomicrobiae bacterium]
MSETPSTNQLDPTDTGGGQRGVTLRSVVIAIVAMFVMGIWIEYEELYCAGGPLAENSPPNSAVGVIWALLIIGGLLYKVRKSFRLVTAELVVIYSALILSAPLMTQGLWHRIFGLVTSIPHHQDFKSYESLPPMLWPHGDNLIANGRFENELADFTASAPQQLGWTELDWKNRRWKVPVLRNTDNAAERATLAVTIHRYDARGREVLIPGETFLFAVLVKASGLTKGSAYSVLMQADDNPATPLLVNTEETQPTFALPGGMRRVGVNPVTIPATLREKLTLKVELAGAGQVATLDWQFFNVEAVAGAFAGRKVVREQNLATLDAHERNFTIVRPTNMFSLAGLKYLLTGYIPIAQWTRPLLAWGLLIGGLFLGFLGLNVLMRKQWVENERFTYPLTILPKYLFTTSEGRLAIFRNKIMWVGFAVTLPLVLLKGINFYNPSVPAPIWDTQLSSFVTSPVLKSYLEIVNISTLPFCLLAIALLIETDILFSLWASFLIFQLWRLGGTAFNWTRFPGYPWEFQQAMGGFIAYAGLALFVGRHHLAKVIRIAFGRAKATPDESTELVSYRTALLMVVASLGIFVAWGLWTQMGAGASLLFFGYMLVCGFAASKIRAECGAPFGYLTPYYGMQFVAAVGGFALFQSTGMLVAAIAAGFMCTSVFLLIAPAQVEMMELGRHFRVRPQDVGAGLTLGLLGGLLIGGFVMLGWAYGFGASSFKQMWPYEQNWYFGEFRAGAQNADRAFAGGTLAVPPEAQALNFLQNPNAKGLGLGILITLVLATLRANFMWFPLHPIGYVLASSHFMRGAWFVLFLAWLLRVVLLRLGGAQSIRRGLVPFCVGMFLACIASIVIFDAVGIYLRFHGVMDVYAGMP